MDDERETKRWSRLPDRVPAPDMVEEKPSEDPHDPDFGRDPERDFMLRYAGG